MITCVEFLSHWTERPQIEVGKPIFGLLPLSRLQSAAKEARDLLNARLAMLTAYDRGPGHETEGRFVLVMVLAIPGETRYMVLETPLPGMEPSFPTLVPIFANANWPERELQDLFGIVSRDHPDPRPLAWKGGWPRDRFPLRKDFALDRSLPVERVLVPVTPVEGEGVLEIPVGPIHAGIIEPGHFRFQVIGDTLLALDAQLFFCHRGLEKIAEGRDPLGGLLLSERQCGTCSVSNALSYCQAIEAATGAVIPPRAARLRVILAELERLYNHVNDIAAIAAGVGLAFVTQQGLRIKEELQRLNAVVFGHRFLRNLLQPGGLRVDCPTDSLRSLLEQLSPLRRDMETIIERAMANSIFLDRLETTGVLTNAVARALGGVGPAARASGVASDTRIDHPYAAYQDLSRFTVPTRPEGDVMARFRLRIDELAISIELLEEAVKTLPEGPVSCDLPSLQATGWGLGATESARGENLVLIRLDADRRISRKAVRTASYLNWPLIPTTIRGNIVPDFPLINKSFELCYADVDR